MSRLPQTVRQLRLAGKPPAMVWWFSRLWMGLYIYNIYIGYRVQNTILRTVFPSKTILSYSQIVFHESHLITLNHAWTWCNMVHMQFFFSAMYAQIIFAKCPSSLDKKPNDCNKRAKWCCTMLHTHWTLRAQLFQSSSKKMSLNILHLSLSLSALWAAFSSNFALFRSQPSYPKGSRKWLSDQSGYPMAVKYAVKKKLSMESPNNANLC